VYRVVRTHTRGCGPCEQQYLAFTGAGLPADGRKTRNVLSKFCTLPVLPAPEALREWLADQIGDSRRERRRALLEYLTSRRRSARGETPEGTEPPGTGGLLGAPARLVQTTVVRAKTAAVSLSRVQANVMDLVQRNRALASAAGAVVLLVAGAALTGSHPQDRPTPNRTPPVHALGPVVPAGTATPSAGPSAAPVGAAAVSPGQAPPAPPQPPSSGSPSGNGDGGGGGGTGSTGSPSPSPPPPVVATTFDARRLSYPDVTLSNVTTWHSGEVKTLHLPAGPYAITAVGATPVRFTVDPTGAVHYDPGLAGVSGQGTTTLTLSGLPVTADGTALAFQNLSFSGAATWPAGVRKDLWLLPGRYTFYGPGATGIRVTVAPDGTIDYDPGLSFLSGRGGRTLTVSGLPATVDATRLGQVAFGLAPATGWLDAPKVQHLRMLPGSYSFHVANGRTFKVTITSAGTFDYDPSLTGVSGQGTDTLTVS
jgi:hypothetical protein